MKLHSEILNRVKTAVGIFSNTSVPPKDADFLLKMNLPPLIGRRDAAAVTVGNIIAGDIFALEPEERLRVYHRTVHLLSGIQHDTRAILAVLTSPETLSREKSMFSFWALLFDVALCLETLTATNARLNENIEEATGGFIKPRKTEKNQMLTKLADSEIYLVNRLRELLDAGSPRLDRYREYAAKSFSKTNEQKYRKAYDEYLRIYSEQA